MVNNPLLKACPNELKLANIYPKYISDIFKPARLLFVFNAANNASTYMYIHIKLLESQISVEQFWYITYSFCCLSYLKKIHILLSLWQSNKDVFSFFYRSANLPHQCLLSLFRFFLTKIAVSRQLGKWSMGQWIFSLPRTFEREKLSWVCSLQKL